MKTLQWHKKLKSQPGGSEGIAVAKRIENSFIDSENIGKTKKEEVKEANTEQNETKLKSKEISSEKLFEKQLQEIGNNKELLTAKPKEITGNGEIEETRKPIAKEIVSVKGKINYFKCRHYSTRVINFKSNFYGELKVCQRINRLQVFQGLTLSVYQQKAHHAIKNVC